MGLARFFGLPAHRQYRNPCLLLVLFALCSPRVCDAQAKPAELIEQFKTETVFWKQLEVGQRIVMAKDARVFAELESWLAHPDRHIRGNTAFVLGSLGDPRGFEVISAILSDVSDRSEGQGVSCAQAGQQGKSCWSPRLQIASDHYYAVHLLGMLKEPRAVPILVSLLDDPDINYKVPWALSNIGGKSAIVGLVTALRNPSPQVRIYGIEELVNLHAVEALPDLFPLLTDQTIGVQQGTTVSDVARTAIATLQRVSNPGR